MLANSISPALSIKPTSINNQDDNSIIIGDLNTEMQIGSIEVIIHF